MIRYKMLIEYDGSYLCGWQRQNGPMSVQQAIEEAIYRFTGQGVDLHCAGRTDAGVHALGQVAHFDAEGIKMSNFHIMRAVNFHLRPLLISVISVETVDSNWHARFSAKNKVYLYRVFNRCASSALAKSRALHIPKELDIEAMHAAGKVLIGRHDFSSFRSSSCQAKNPLRTLNSCVIRQDGDWIEFEFQARSFLHNQVRIMVGTLLAVGLGKEQNIADLLAAKDRRRAHKTVAACGLYLARVDY